MCKQANISTNICIQTNEPCKTSQTYLQTYKHTYKETDLQTDALTNVQNLNNKHINEHTYKHTCKQTNIETKAQKYKLTNKQSKVKDIKNMRTCN